MDRETCALQHYRLTVRRIRSLRKIGRFTGKKNINTIIERCRAEAGRSSPSPPGPVIAGNVSARTVPDATDGPPESKTGPLFSEAGQSWCLGVLCSAPVWERSGTSRGSRHVARWSLVFDPRRPLDR